MTAYFDSTILIPVIENVDASGKWMNPRRPRGVHMESSVMQRTFICKVPRAISGEGWGCFWEISVVAFGVITSANFSLDHQRTVSMMSSR